MKILTLLFLISINTFAQLPTNYQSLDADKKRDLLWQNIEKSSYEDNNIKLPKFNLFKFGLNALKAADPSFVRVSFDLSSDEMPLQKSRLTGELRRRPKIIHGLGSSALVRFIPTEDHSYTGIFSKESIGLARVSTSDPSKFTPGMAVKFFIDGKPSVNIHVMHGLTHDQEQCHPFKDSFSNIIDPPSGFLAFAAKTFQIIAKEKGGNANHLTLDHLADVGEETPKAVHKIEFRASKKALSLPFHCSYEYREIMSYTYLKEGVKLYDVFANSSEGEELKKIGELMLDSSFVTSEYGDKVLFFQHDIRRK